MHLTRPSGSPALTQPDQIYGTPWENRSPRAHLLLSRSQRRLHHCFLHGRTAVLLILCHQAAPFRTYGMQLCTTVGGGAIARSPAGNISWVIIYGTRVVVRACALTGHKSQALLVEDCSCRQRERDMHARSLHDAVTPDYLCDSPVVTATPLQPRDMQGFRGSAVTSLDFITSLEKLACAEMQWLQDAAGVTRIWWIKLACTGAHGQRSDDGFTGRL